VVEPKRYNRNLYHISKISHERALVSCRSYTAYATAVLDDYFKPSVTLFCTCTGSSKGRAADRNQRASLPKEALDVFVGKYKCSEKKYIMPFPTTFDTKK
jgi:hypothetical protein